MRSSIVRVGRDLDIVSFSHGRSSLYSRMAMTKQFKVGDVVRLTITDKDAEDGQWFETTVTGVSSKCGVLLNLEGFIAIFSTDEGDGYGDRRIIEKGARFELGIQKFCFYSSDDIGEESDMEWTEFKATLELVVYPVVFY